MASVPIRALADSSSHPTLLIENQKHVLPLDDSLKLTSFDELASPDFNKANTYLLVCLLSLKHANQNEDMKLSYAFSRNKQARPSLFYSRMFTFGCPNSPGRCAAMFSTNDSCRENDLWGEDAVLYREQCHVGSWFLILEPNPVSQITQIGRFLKLETNWPLFPIKQPMLCTNIPVPSNPNHAVSFFVVGAQLEIADTISISATCGGTFCDRQHPTVKRCGCYSQVAKTTNFVYRSHVKLPHSGIGGLFSSFRFSVMPFKTENDLYKINSPLRTVFQVRKAYAKLLEYVNANDGFTVVGWRMRGVTNSDNENNMSEILHDHIISIVPSNDEDLRAFRDSEHALNAESLN